MQPVVLAGRPALGGRRVEQLVGVVGRQLLLLSPAASRQRHPAAAQGAALSLRGDSSSQASVPEGQLLLVLVVVLVEEWSGWHCPSAGMWVAVPHSAGG